MKNLILSAVLVVACVADSVLAAPGNVDKGTEIYNKRCIWCHGEDGDGSAVGFDRLNPPPRDFTLGMYKIKSSSMDDMVPNDENIFRMIKYGMPGNFEVGKTPMNPGGTAMPGWGDILSDQDIWDLVAYIKVLSEYEEEIPEAQVDFGTQIESSEESIAKGKELFLDGERCTECHGNNGKGDGIKALKGDVGERTWPRNLTKPWTYRASNSPKDIFTRITTGIPGTQMPSFADPSSEKSLSTEDRWHIANYVYSIGNNANQPDPENIVIKATRAEGELPTGPDDSQWAETTFSSFFLIPQFIGKERFFTPSNDTILVRAIYNDTDIALLLEWDDRSKSIPGDKTAIKVADPNEVYQDAVAVQLPVVLPKGVQIPYFGMGDISNPVNIWHWKSGTTDNAENVELMNGLGFTEIEKRDISTTGIQATSTYDNGTWRVMMKRPLSTPTTDKDIQFTEGVFIPIAFAAWDGSNNEQGSKHTMTTWYWLLLQPSAGTKPIMIGLLVLLSIFGVLVWWARTATAAKESEA